MSSDIKITMSVDPTQNVPEIEKSTEKFEEFPMLATMIAGGVVIAVLSYFISQWFLTSFRFQQFIFLEWVFPILILIGSFYRGMKPDTTIEINYKSGWVTAKNHSYYWEGYANEADQFLVLQKETEDRHGNNITEYKIYIELSDKSKYEVPLEVRDVRKAMSVIQKAKEATPEFKESGNLIN